MTYRHNSTIRIKEKICSKCRRKTQIFSRGRCASCAKIEDTLNRMAEETEIEISQDKDLEYWIGMADDAFSKWLRLSQADKDGYVECFILGKKIRWEESQAAHYIKRRASLFLRWDTRNVTVQSKEANEYGDGMYPEYTEKLERLHPGLVDILKEEAATYYKVSRSDVENIYREYNTKYRNLLNSRK